MAFPKEVVAKIKTQVEKGEKTLEELNENLAIAQLAGIDVAERLKERDELRTKFSKIKAAFEL